MRYSEGDLVLCTVDQVNNTMTSLHLPDGTNGTIVSSEIASGRIKFMRAYVVPNKKIVCKILRVNGSNISLSLRRVGAKERGEVMKEYKQKLAVRAGFKNILNGDYNSVKEKIMNDYEDFGDFVDVVRKDCSILEKYVPDGFIEQIKGVFEKKKKQVELRYTLSVKCLEADGIKKIKEILDFGNEGVKIHYLSAGSFSLKYTCDDFKSGKQKAGEFLEEIKQKAKDSHCEFDYKEEKH